MTALVPQGQKKIPVLMYHSISDHASRGFRRFAVSPASFAEQMAYLHDHAYTPVTVTQFVDAIYNKKGILPKKPVILTFDDGFADFYSEAFPVLRRYRFVATLYIVTAFVGNTSCWLVREGEASRPMLTWEQLAEISAYGIECGGHTQSHPQLDLLPRDRAREEIVRCKAALENHLGCAVGSFAYPFGYYSVGVRRLVQEAGYTSACAVRYAMSSESDDPYALARLIVKNDTSIEAFASLLSGQGISSVFTLYKALQAPLWRTARRSVALAVHSFQKGVFLQ